MLSYFLVIHYNLIQLYLSITIIFDVKAASIKMQFINATPFNESWLGLLTPWHF